MRDAGYGGASHGHPVESTNCYRMHEMADTSLGDSEACQPPSGQAVVKLANHLLTEFNIPTRIKEVGDISAALFVVLYESLFSDRLPGIIRQPASKEDEIHNCQIVIDVLSTDVVRDSLSHIRGADIVSGDVTAIFNLLDIFSYLLEYVVNKIESDVDQDESRSVTWSEPEEKAAAHMPTKQDKNSEEMPQMSRNMKHSLASSNKTNNNGRTVEPSANRHRPSGNRNENRKAFDDHKVISHEDYYAMTHGGLHREKTLCPPSPIKPDQSESLLGQKTLDSDFDTDTEKRSEQVDYQNFHPKLAWYEKPSASMQPASYRNGVTLKDEPQMSTGAAISTATAVAATSEQDLDKSGKELGASGQLSASMPYPSRAGQEGRHDPLRSTVGPIIYHSHHSPANRPKPDPQLSPPDRVARGEGSSSSYTDLRQLVERTAAMTRLALETSPVRGRTQADLNITDIEERPWPAFYSEGMRLQSALASEGARPRPALSSEGVRLAQELNAMALSPALRREEQAQKAGKKVAFVSSAGGLSMERDREPLSPLSDNRLRDEPYLWSAGCSPEPGVEAGRSRTKKGGHPKSKTATLAKHLAQNRQPELGAAHMTLKTEDRAIRRKQDILRKFYEKDWEEMREDVDYMLGRDSQKSKDIEEEYLKKCRQAAPKSKVNTKSKVTHKVTAGRNTVGKKAKSKVTSSKVKPSTDTTKRSQVSGPVRLESEEDLLPFVLDEFPHLHLSEHTWHELWRKGLHQIEALTRAYQESQRKKSKAQTQLEEAAQKHDLLANIMRKQLDHTQRMRELKEQKQQQVQMRNKNHEKRIQSARARRYYNDYQVRARSKQLKRRTKEEMVFRELFKDALDIQKERIKDIRQYATDQRKRHETRRQNEIDSLENFYQDQFEMLGERLVKERLESELRDTAQQQMMERMKRELRQKMEKEIKLYQEQMLKDDDDVHFRQMDADRVRQSLQRACYSAKI